MGKFDRKTVQRLREKLKKKNKKLTLRDRKESSDILVSFCSEHGPYTENKLCACYDDNGQMDGMAYLDQPLTDEILFEGCICPIHGDYTKDSLCACYDESGNLREDWDKKIK